MAALLTGLSQLQPISSSPVKALDSCLPLGTAPRFGESCTEGRAAPCVVGYQYGLWYRFAALKAWSVLLELLVICPWCSACGLASPTSSCRQEGANSPPQSPHSAPAAQEHL